MESHKDIIGIVLELRRVQDDYNSPESEYSDVELLQFLKQLQGAFPRIAQALLIAWDALGDMAESQHAMGCPDGDGGAPCDCYVRDARKARSHLQSL